jgi:Holliday junction resolvase RusA-like endonuclease
VIRLTVLGTPAPKGSARAFINKRTGRAFVAPGGAKSTEIKIASWNVAVRQAASEAIAGGALTFRECPLKVSIVFRLVRPRGHYSKATGQLLPSAPAFPATKPDIDKLARTTLDAMTGSIFDDDSRIATLYLDKEWAEPGREGATITVESLLEWKRSKIDREISTARKVGDLFGDVMAKAMYP